MGEVACTTEGHKMAPILAVALVVFGVPTLYVAIRSREFRKFLAGAFFVSGGMQVYFYLRPCFGAPRFHKPSSDTRAQWHTLDPSFHFLPGHVLFWLHQEGKGFKQVRTLDRCRFARAVISAEPTDVELNRASACAHSTVAPWLDCRTPPSSTSAALRF